MIATICQFIEATNRLASGDFSARLNITHPPEYRVLSDNFNHMAEELAGIEVLRTDFINNFFLMNLKHLLFQLKDLLRF